VNKFKTYEIRTALINPTEPSTPDGKQKLVIIFHNKMFLGGAIVCERTGSRLLKNIMELAMFRTMRNGMWTAN
jgi:hypothetical protein